MLQPIVSVSYSAADFRAMIWHCRACRNRLFFFLFLPLAVLSFGWAFGDEAIRGREIGAALFLGALIAGAFVLVGPPIQVRNQRKAGFVEPFTFSFTDDGIKVAHPRQDVVVRWVGLHGIAKSLDRLFLFTSPGCALIVPRRCFDDDRAFQAWISKAEADFAANKA